MHKCYNVVKDVYEAEQASKKAKNVGRSVLKFCVDDSVVLAVEAKNYLQVKYNCKFETNGEEICVRSAVSDLIM